MTTPAPITLDERVAAVDLLCSAGFTPTGADRILTVGGDSAVRALAGLSLLDPSDEVLGRLHAMTVDDITALAEGQGR